MKNFANNIQVALGAFLLICSLMSCSNAERDAKKIWDSSPAQEFAHSGKFKGYAAVYTIDWLEDTKTRSSETYRVYEKSNGDYIIDYNGKNCILQKANPPYGEGIYSLKWKIDYNHYIEEIPSSY